MLEKGCNRGKFKFGLWRLLCREEAQPAEVMRGNQVLEKEVQKAESEREREKEIREGERERERVELPVASSRLDSVDV